MKGTVGATLPFIKMTDIVEVSEFPETITLLDKGMRARGGVPVKVGAEWTDGDLNIPIVELAKRTRFLKDQLATVMPNADGTKKTLATLHLVMSNGSKVLLPETEDVVGIYNSWPLTGGDFVTLQIDTSVYNDVVGVLITPKPEIVDRLHGWKLEYNYISNDTGIVDGFVFHPLPNDVLDYNDNLISSSEPFCEIFYKQLSEGEGQASVLEPIVIKVDDTDYRVHEIQFRITIGGYEIDWINPFYPDYVYDSKYRAEPTGSVHDTQFEYTPSGGLVYFSGSENSATVFCNTLLDHTGPEVERNTQMVPVGHTVTYFNEQESTNIRFALFGAPENDPIGDNPATEMGNLWRIIVPDGKLPKMAGQNAKVTLTKIAPTIFYLEGDLENSGGGSSNLIASFYYNSSVVGLVGFGKVIDLFSDSEYNSETRLLTSGLAGVADMRYYIGPGENGMFRCYANALVQLRTNGEPDNGDLTNKGGSVVFESSENHIWFVPHPTRLGETYGNQTTRWPFEPSGDDIYFQTKTPHLYNACIVVPAGKLPIGKPNGTVTVTLDESSGSRWILSGDLVDIDPGQVLSININDAYLTSNGSFTDVLPLRNLTPNRQYYISRSSDFDVDLSALGAKADSEWRFTLLSDITVTFLNADIVKKTDKLTTQSAMFSTVIVKQKPKTNGYDVLLFGELDNVVV